jgi:hypothetical protein
VVFGVLACQIDDGAGEFGHGVEPQRDRTEEFGEIRGDHFPKKRLLVAEVGRGGDPCWLGRTSRPAAVGSGTRSALNGTEDAYRTMRLFAEHVMPVLEQESSSASRTPESSSAGPSQ